jgi:hypothetical protein
MAQSIYVTLATLETETSVPEIKDSKGNILRENFGMVTHKLPADQLPNPEQFENEELLLTWATENGFLHSCLQKGVNQHVIDLRAKFKLMKKGDTWSPDYGDNNMEVFTWKIKARPENAKTDEEKAIDAMSKLSPEKLAELIANMS